MTATRAMRVAALLALMIFTSAANADPTKPPAAFIGVPDSIEQAVHESDVVVDGRIVDVRELEFRDQYRVTIDVTERIKGEAPARLSFDVEIPSGNREALSHGRRGPFFLINPPQGAESYGVRDARDVLPWTERAWFSALLDLRWLGSSEELLATARAAAAAARALRSVHLLVPGDRSDSGVSVPVTDELAARAARWADHDDWKMRRNAASVSSARVRQEAEPILVRLLRDPHYEVSGGSRSHRRYYPVRDVAHIGLVAHGISRPAVVHEPDDSYVDVHWLHWSIFAAALTILCFLAVQARQRLLPARRCWPAARLFEAWLVVLVMLVGASVRGQFRADQLVFDADPATYQFISHESRLQLVRRPRPGSVESLRFASLPVGTDLDQTWDTRKQMEWIERRRLGVSIARELGHEDSEYSIGAALVMPVWLLLLVSLLLPALSWTFAVAGWFREARRRRCVQCGYDLRASIDRCPECGTEVFGLKTRRQVAATQAAQANYERELRAYREHEARMLELLAAGAVDEEGRPVRRVEGEASPSRES